MFTKLKGSRNATLKIINNTKKYEKDDKENDPIGSYEVLKIKLFQNCIYHSIFDSLFVNFQSEIIDYSVVCY